MEVRFSDDAIVMEKELNIIDSFVIDVCKVLGEHARYVIVSGYLSILFGKVRGTEDIDVFIERMGEARVVKLCSDLERHGFEVFNARSAQDAHDMLASGVAPRIARKGEWVPNVELKFPKEKLGSRALEDRTRVLLNGSEFFIGSIEQNIAFKIFLGSRKDIDDACYLYLLFKGLKHLDERRIEAACAELGVGTQVLRRCEDG